MGFISLWKEKLKGKSTFSGRTPFQEIYNLERTSFKVSNKFKGRL